jgi:uncharacterized membrane protein YphA (DoxX/SURF4 family)
MNSKNSTITRAIMMYWVTTGLVAIVFLITGIGNLVPMVHIAQDMAHLGYPPYFHIILGVWKVLGAVTIVIPGTPRMKEWAYAGMMFDLTGAVFSRLASAGHVVTIVVPFAIAILVTASWALRPETRRLKPSSK